MTSASPVHQGRLCLPQTLALLDAPPTDTGVGHTSTGTSPGYMGFCDTLRVVYHLVLSGWDVEDAATWMGISPCVARRQLPLGMS